MALRIPPLLWLLLCGLLMRPAILLPAGSGMQWRPLAWPLLLAGMLIMTGAAASFVRRHTTLHPQQPQVSNTLVTDGLFRYSRNPMYLGMALCLAGWALWLAQVWAWPGVAVFVAVITRWQIVPEERILAAKFGGAYAAYCRRTRRWL